MIPSPEDIYDWDTEQLHLHLKDLRLLLAGPSLEEKKQKKAEKVINLI